MTTQLHPADLPYLLLAVGIVLLVFLGTTGLVSAWRKDPHGLCVLLAALLWGAIGLAGRRRR